MPFLQNDGYLVRGNNQIVRGDWKSTVYKFDASSFYNWEQDNLPLYDLEERTELNWEQQGYPASSLTGMQLLVSSINADGVPVEIDSTAPYQVFSTVSAAMAKIPRVLRFPVVLEVATSGDLGNIDIHDFEFVENGGLEIINRGFAKILSGSSVGNFDLKASGTNASSILMVSSLDLSNTIKDTSALATSTNITVAGGGPGPHFWNNYNRSIIRMADVYTTNLGGAQAEYGTATTDTPGDLRNNGLTVNVRQTDANFLAGKDIFKFNQYYDNTTSSDYNYNQTLGVKALRPSNMNSLQLSANEQLTGGVYANSARRISIKNCNGPLYVRGFIVDGYRGSNDPEAGEAISHEIEDGIDIENSKVVLENCAAMRCGKTGLKTMSSEVTLNRGFTAYRIYSLSSPGHFRGVTPAFGLEATNSEITLSAAYNLSAGIPCDSPFSFAFCPVGVRLTNSILKTPQGGRGTNMAGESVAAAVSPFWQIYLDVFLNTKVGLEAIDSTIDFNHTIMSYMNEVGIKLDNTTLMADEIVADHHNWYGLQAKDSIIQYYKNLNGLTNGPNQVLSFLYNGQNLNLEKCIFKNKHFDNWVDKVQNRFQIDSGGYKVRNGITIPGVSLKNTQANFLQMKTLWNVTHDGYSFKTGSPMLGIAYYFDEGSDVKFLGTSGSYYNRIEGPNASYASLLDSVAIYADNSSKVEFNGPTVINKSGINVGANNNSSIKFAPHNSEGRLNASSFALSDTTQHTRVELQSFKACVVANNDSTIEMRDCGDFNRYWASSTDEYVVNTTSGLIPKSDYNADNARGTELFTSGGYIQFYPNPIVRGITGVTNPKAFGNPVTGLNPASILNGINVPELSAAADYNTYSWGGVCVKADKGSEVTVLNTHFPCGWQNASATILDVSAGDPNDTNCGKVYIWNIGDDSRLHASHIIVSGAYPGGSLYHGPSGVYVSSTGGCGGVDVILSGAPGSTPDSGRLSVLDSFGAVPPITIPVGLQLSSVKARDTFENKGPFRIYFSVNPMAQYLGYTRGKGAGASPTTNAYQTSSNFDGNLPVGLLADPSAVEIGEPYQELSQGYNPSRDCSTPDPSFVSAIYNQLGFQTALNAGGTPLSTTFFYASGMLDDSYVSRIWLDDSAMNTFANAKNATKGTSARPKLVSYYKATTGKYGSSFAGLGGTDSGSQRLGFGLGFRSSNIFDFHRDT